MNANIETGHDRSRVSHSSTRCNSFLIREVLEVTNRIESNQLTPVASGQAGIAIQPLPLLGLVTYHYAVGILPSREIERELWTNAAFRAVCGSEFPRWQLIRRFRRLNRPMIHDCLEETLRRALHAEVNSIRNQRLSAFTDCSAEAETRITNATLLDNDDDEQ